MKQIIIIILLTFCVSNVFAQQYTPMTAAGYQMKRLKVDSTLHIPSFCGVPTTRNSTAKEGAIAIDTCNNLLYTWTNGDGWTSLSGGTIVDTAAINAAIALRVKYSDTLLMLQPYLRKIDTTNKWVNSVTKINDSTIRVIKNTLTTDLLIRGNGVKYSDTAAMLLPYLRKVDTTAMLSKYLRKIDTTAMLLPYLRKIDTTAMLSKYLRRTDTTAMLLPYLRKIDTTNKFVNNVTKINDSTIRIFKGTTSSDLLIRGNASSGSGTVTSVATGYGLSGGPITTTGTLIVDSATLSTKYLRRTDTTAMLLPYLRKIDTTAMLNPYLRKIDTTAMLLPYLRKIDTTAMLSKYLRKTDTTTMLNPYLRKIDTTNKFVNNVTSINDSTIRIFKGTTSTDLLIRGNASSGGGNTLQDVLTAGNNASNFNNFNFTLAELQDGGDGQKIFNVYNLDKPSIKAELYIGPSEPYFNFGRYEASGTIDANSVEIKPSGILFNSEAYSNYHLNIKGKVHSNNYELIFPLPQDIVSEIDTLATLRDVRSSGGGSTIDTTNRFVNSVTSVNDSTIRVFKGSTSSTITIKGSTTGYVPYNGATNDVDLGTRILSTQSLRVTGTNGAGDIHLRHQATDATATGQSTSLFADANGDLKYKNAGNFYTTLKTSGNAANAIYTYPSATTTLIGAADTSVFLRKTDSATYYTKYRSDTSRTNIYSAINGKQASGSYITTSDTSVFQRKNIAAYSLQANNTNAAANVTTQTYRDVAEAAISGTITWVTGTAPTTLTSANYSWQQIGKVVTVQVSLLYTNPSAAITAFYFPLPSDMPLPVTPTGWSAASNYLFTGSGTTHTTVTNLGTLVFASFIRRDAANTGYEIGGGGSASSARGYKLNLTYKAQ